MTHDFGRSKFPNCIGIARRSIVSPSTGAAPRGGVAGLPVSFAGGLRREPGAAGPETDRHGGTQRAVDRAQICSGAPHAAQPSSL
ncbi:hypothetical protein EMIT0111MI5_10332 [Burkholderia sp. IT-111MI5]